VADGTGQPLRAAIVRIHGDTIRDVGSIAAAASERVIDGAGLVLAPGFIDPHNHSTDVLDSDPLAVSQISPRHHYGSPRSGRQLATARCNPFSSDGASMDRH
jgi:N-acyl-D-aspartate/D-glutamate deacylase